MCDRQLAPEKPHPEDTRYFRQSVLAAKLNREFLVKVVAKARYLGLEVVQIHDSLDFQGDPRQVREMESYIRTLWEKLGHAAESPGAG